MSACKCFGFWVYFFPTTPLTLDNGTISQQELQAQLADWEAQQETVGSPNTNTIRNLFIQGILRYDLIEIATKTKTKAHNHSMFNAWFGAVAKWLASSCF